MRYRFDHALYIDCTRVSLERRSSMFVAESSRVLLALSISKERRQ